MDYSSTTKTGHEVANAFSRILKERRPSKMWVDKGREFYNKDVQKLVELYSTENEENLVWLKDLIELLRKKLFKYFSANNTRKYVDVLDLLVDQYNNTIHSAIKMTPKEASRKENENKVWRNFYPEFGFKTLTPKVSIGDNVRITKKKKTFDKGYTEMWTEAVFKISRIQLTIPVAYKITDYNGEEIQGSFYEQELEKTSQGTFRIEKVLKRQWVKSLVKWMGYPKSFNYWLDTKAMVKL